MFNIPVLFIVFNRIDTTQSVLEAIRDAKPRQLFIGADGPRKNKLGEAEKCDEVRSAVINSIDWECDVYTLFREENKGCGLAVSEAITWFFSHVEMGIILEDDCLPDKTFFKFAEELLIRYADNDNIMNIGGFNYQCGIPRSNGSYYFSKLSSTWGWATWRRAWQKYSFDFFGDENSKIISVLNESLSNSDDKLFLYNEFIKTKNKVYNTWDFQWLYTLMKNNGLSIVPQYNLVTNLGFNSEGTHTFDVPYWCKYLVNKPIKNIVINDSEVPNIKADNFHLSLILGRKTVETTFVKIMYEIRKIIFKNI